MYTPACQERRGRDTSALISSPDGRHDNARFARVFAWHTPHATILYGTKRRPLLCSQKKKSSSEKRVTRNRSSTHPMVHDRPTDTQPHTQENSDVNVPKYHRAPLHDVIVTRCSTNPAGRVLRVGDEGRTSRQTKVQTQVTQAAQQGLGTQSNTGQPERPTCNTIQPWPVRPVNCNRPKPPTA